MGFVLLAGLYVARIVFRKEPLEDHHPHRLSPHGGVIVATGDEEGHFHVEALVDRGRMLKLYTYGEKVDELLRVDYQILTVEVKPEAGAESVPLVLMPMPQPKDAEGKTSRFFGKLPVELAGKALTIHVPDIRLGGRPFQFDFTTAGPENHGDRPPDHDEEEKLFLSPGGKYTQADIGANGGMTAPRSYKGFRASHDIKPQQGERLCPVSLTKANRKCIWAVAGKTYLFCCPPCIDEFVRRAKQHPQTIKEPEEYVKK
jgi:hypothetical protein